MINIYYKEKEIKTIFKGDATDGNLESEFKIYKSKNHLFLIDYEAGGTETSCKISFEIKDKDIDKYFPLQYDDGSETLVNYEKTFYPGNKYRMILPTIYCEEFLKIKLNFNGDTSSISNMNIYILPDFQIF